MFRPDARPSAHADDQLSLSPIRVARRKQLKVVDRCGAFHAKSIGLFAGPSSLRGSLPSALQTDEIDELIEPFGQAVERVLRIHLKFGRRVHPFDQEEIAATGNLLQDGSGRRVDGRDDGGQRLFPGDGLPARRGGEAGCVEIGLPTACAGRIPAAGHSERHFAAGHLHVVAQAHDVRHRLSDFCQTHAGGGLAVALREQVEKAGEAARGKQLRVIVDY